jgi:hypothetical protein
MNKEIVCAKCNTDPICPQCNYDIFKRPLVIKHIDKEMPIIVHTCCICSVILFKSMTYETRTMHRNFCMACASQLEMPRSL